MATEKTIINIKPVLLQLTSRISPRGPSSGVPSAKCPASMAGLACCGKLEAMGLDGAAKVKASDAQAATAPSRTSARLVVLRAMAAGLARKPGLKQAETAAATIVFRSSRIIHWPKLHLVKRRLGSNSTPTMFSDGTFPENLCFYTDLCFQIPILPPTFTLVSSPPAPSIFRLAESWITRLQPPQLPSFTISFCHQIWLSYIFLQSHN